VTTSALSAVPPGGVGGRVRRGKPWPVQRRGFVGRVLGRPHFNGWCLRTTEASGTTTSAIVGAFLSGRGKRSQHLVAVLRRTADGRVEARQRIVYDGVLGASDFSQEGDSSNRRVLWRSPTSGALWLTPDDALRCRLRLDDDDVTVDMTVEPPDGRKLAFFDAEGWLGRRPWRWALPCRYDVWTLNSPCSVDGRSALAHVEYNCGRAFPRNWIWSQAHRCRGRGALLVVGGDFLPGNLPRTWLLAFRSPAVGEVNLRTVDPSTTAVEATVDPANGLLKLTLQTKTLLVDLVVKADPASFFPDRLFVPTPRGFSDQPGSAESFAATATVRVYEPGDDRRQSFRLVEAKTFHDAALEFGGEFLKDDDDGKH